MTDLDKQLQQMAASDWERFSKMIGEDALISAKICMLRYHHNRSLGEIRIKLSVSRDKVKYECKHCPTE